MTRLNNINNVAAVIPFYNERDTINEVIERTKNYVSYIFAVDDGSTDGSSEAIIKSENVFVIRDSINRGKGYALRTGMNAAFKKGFTEIVTLDADLQHKPEEIPFLLNGLSDFDVVIGNRLNDLKGMPFQRRFSNRITSKLLSIKTGQKLLDSQCGFRAYRSEIIEKIQTEKNGYEAESEILIRASLMGFRIGFTDVSTIYGNEKSKMNGFRTTVDFIKILFL